MRSIVWDGEKLVLTDTLEVRAPGEGEVRVQVLRSGLSSHDYDARADLMAWSISRSICNPDGSQVDDEGNMVLSESDAKKLTEEAFLKLFSVVISLNIRKADSAGKSQPTNGGGTPSPSPLADAPLPN